MKPGSGDIFATCSVDTTALVWTTDEDKKPLISKLSGHTGYVIALEWISGTDRIVTASWDHTIKESIVTFKCSEMNLELGRVKA